MRLEQLELGERSPMADAVTFANSCDQVPYTARPFVETHPDRLATIRMPFGMKVQPIETHTSGDIRKDRQMLQGV